ncbi:MAG: hypothetical protein AAF356_03400 [Planctomycetota bacterium]
MPTHTLCALSAVLLVNPAGDPASDPLSNAAWDSAWPAAEAWVLRDHVQLTSRDVYLKAGESYFDPAGSRIVFQGIPVPPPGEAPGEHYGMYVAEVIMNDRGDIEALTPATLVSAPGSANTCGWFHPDGSGTLLFGTTTRPPALDQRSGYQRGTSRYVWQFPREMDIVVRTPDADAPDGYGPAEPMFERYGYDAEASWSPDGRFVLYTRVRAGIRPEEASDDGDLWIYDTREDAHTALVVAPGYDGGAFFDPAGERICYRSDRRGDKLLQVMVADLVFDSAGRVTGIADETKLTDNQHVNWAPFFDPTGEYLVYATSEIGHANYEVFAVRSRPLRLPSGTSILPPRVRITEARGFDGLPVFTPDGSWMMWTAQRGAMAPGEGRPSSQLWAARFDWEAFNARYAQLVRRTEAAERDRELEEGFEAYTPE